MNPFNAIIRSIKLALINEEELSTHLNNNSDLTWIEDYPIAIVHENTRVKDQMTLTIMQSLPFFNEDGFSNNIHSIESIGFLNQHAPKFIKNASMLCCGKNVKEEIEFREKFTHDKWKKVVNTHDFRATIEISDFGIEKTIKEIETELRDLMRSRKEIPSLKPIGFVWIATVSNTTNLTDIMKHYFQGTHALIESNTTRTYIAWNEVLNDISLRDFVVQPS